MINFVQVFIIKSVTVVFVDVPIGASHANQFRLKSH